MGKLKYYGLDKRDYDDCRDKISEANQNVINRVLTISLIMIPMLIVISYFLEFFKIYRRSYYQVVFGLISFSIIIRFLHKYKIKNKNTIFSYLLMTILFTFGIIVSTFMKDKSATVYISLILILPILFIDNLLRMTVFVGIMNIIFSLITFMIKVPAIASHDIITSLGYGVIVIFLHYHLGKRNLIAFISDRNSSLAIDSYQEIENELKSLLKKDSMTGLYNHVAFIKNAQELLNAQNNPSYYVALGILDLDNFKIINDNFGHQIGDAVIIKVAEVLKANMNENDIVGRLGGDEYIFLFVNIKEKQEIELRLKKILEEITSLGDTLDLKLNGSSGIVLTNDQNLKIDQLYSKADTALYHAKNSGKNCYNFYVDLDDK